MSAKSLRLVAPVSPLSDKRKGEQVPAREEDPCGLWGRSRLPCCIRKLNRGTEPRQEGHGVRGPQGSPPWSLDTPTCGKWIMQGRACILRVGHGAWWGLGWPEFQAGLGCAQSAPTECTIWNSILRGAPRRRGDPCFTETGCLPSAGPPDDLSCLPGTGFL